MMMVMAEARPKSAPRPAAKGEAISVADQNIGMPGRQSARLDHRRSALVIGFDNDKIVEIVSKGRDQQGTHRQPAA